MSELRLRRGFNTAAQVAGVGHTDRRSAAAWVVTRALAKTGEIPVLPLLPQSALSLCGREIGGVGPRVSDMVPLVGGMTGDIAVRLLGGDPAFDVKQFCDSTPAALHLLLPTHSTLAGIVSGFALTGASVLFALDRSSRSNSRIDGTENAALGLLACSISGLLAAYIYSAETSSSCLVQQYEPSIAGAHLGLAASLMLIGIGLVANARMAGTRGGFFGGMMIYRGVLVIIVGGIADRVRIDAAYSRSITNLYRHWNLVGDGNAATPGEYARRLYVIASKLFPKADPADYPTLMAGRVSRAVNESLSLGVKWTAVMSLPAVLATILVIVSASPRPRMARLAALSQSVRAVLPVVTLTLAVIMVAITFLILNSSSGFGDAIYDPPSALVWGQVGIVAIAPATTLAGFWTDKGSNESS